MKTIDDNAGALRQGYEELEEAGYYDIALDLGARRDRASSMRQRQKEIAAAGEEPFKPIRGYLLPKDKKAPLSWVRDDEVPADKRDQYKPDPRPGEPLAPKIEKFVPLISVGEPLIPTARALGIPQKGLRKLVMNMAYSTGAHKHLCQAKIQQCAITILKNPERKRSRFGLYRLDGKWHLIPSKAPTVLRVLESRERGQTREEIAEDRMVIAARIGWHIAYSIYNDGSYREALQQARTETLWKEYPNELKLLAKAEYEKAWYRAQTPRQTFWEMNPSSLISA